MGRARQMGGAPVAFAIALAAVVWCPPTQADDSGPGSQWTLQVSTDPISDMPNAHLVMRSDDDPQVFLGVGCNQGFEIRFLVITDDYLGSGSIDVEYRIDTAPAERATWGITTKGNSLGLFGSARPLVAQLLTAEKFIVRYTPYRENVQINTFTVAGLGAVFGPVADACNWQP